jgi:peptidoglycan/LPS O-acetylase OafA/YrhL
MYRWNLPANFFFFGSGILLAFFRLYVERAKPAWLLEHRLLGNSDAWFLASIPLWLVFFYSFKLVPLIAIVGFLMLGAATLPLRRGRILPLLDWKPTAVLGVASYSLYCWHQPILEHMREIGGFPQSTLGTYLLVLPVCIGVALLSFRVIEAPFLRMRQRWSPASAAIDKKGPTIGEAAPAAPATP